MKIIILSVIFFFSGDLFSKEKERQFFLEEEWAIDDSSKIQGISSFSYKENPEIILKISRFQIDAKAIKELSDNEILDQSFDGKKFSDQIYEYSEIKKISQMLKRFEGHIEISVKESYKNDLEIPFYRVNRIILNDNSFYNAELIWPQKHNHLINEAFLKKIEKINVL